MPWRVRQLMPPRLQYAPDAFRQAPARPKRGVERCAGACHGTPVRCSTKPVSTSSLSTRFRLCLVMPQDVEELGDGQAGPALDEVQHAVMGAAESRNRRGCGRDRRRSRDRQRTRARSGRRARSRPVPRLRTQARAPPRPGRPGQALPGPGGIRPWLDVTGLAAALRLWHGLRSNFYVSVIDISQTQDYRSSA